MMGDKILNQYLIKLLLQQRQKEFDVGFNFLLKSPVLKYYLFDTYLKKRSAEKNNQLLAGFIYNENHEESKVSHTTGLVKNETITNSCILQFDSILGWRQDNKHIIDGDFAISSNIFPIEKFNTSVFITEGEDPEFNINILYGKASETPNEMKFNIHRKDSTFKGELMTPFKEYANVQFSGSLAELGQSGTFKARGNVFKNLLPHSFEGDVTFHKSLPVQAELTFKDAKQGDATLTYNLKFEDMKRSISTKIAKNNDFISFESELYIQHLTDWAYNIKIQSSKPELNELMLSTTLTPFSKNQFESSFEMITPWQDYFIDNVNVSSNLKLNGNDGDFKMDYQISKLAGSGGCSWKYLEKPLRQDYQLKVFTEKKDKSKHFSTEIAYTNTTKAPTDVKFIVDVNSIWLLSSKAKFDIKNPKDMSLTYDLSLPEPVKSNHKLAANYKGHDFPPRIENGAFSDFRFGYESEALAADLKASGAIRTSTDIYNKMSLEWGPKLKPSKLDSDFKLQKVDEKTECSWDLSTPYYADEKTLNLKANYQTQDIFKIIHATVHSPESRQITLGDVAFTDLTNMKGSVNCSLPIFNLTWFDVNFDFDEQNEESVKFIKATWPDNSALLDSKSKFVNTKQHKEWTGTIKTELPLHTKHNVQIVYGLEVINNED